jgi:hypothetical protein
MKFNLRTPVTMVRIDIIFNVLTGSLIYVIPITETNKKTAKVHMAYIKLRSKCLSANIKILKDMRQNRNIKI